MKPKIRKILVLFSALWTCFWIIKWMIEFGVQPNISINAKYLTELGRDWEFYIWVLIPGGIIMYIGKSLWAAFACGMIIMMGIVTGYNPEIESQKLENFFHVFFVGAATSFMIVDLIQKAKRYGNKKLARKTILVFVIFLIGSWLIKYKNHTTFIEIVDYAMIYVYYYFMYIPYFPKKERMKK